MKPEAWIQKKGLVAKNQRRIFYSFYDHTPEFAFHETFWEPSEHSMLGVACVIMVGDIAIGGYIDADVAVCVLPS